MPGQRIKPYVQGAGPLPEDEYGDGHMQVSDQYSKRTNMNIVGQNPTDQTISGMQMLYGTPGIPGAPYSDGPGLNAAEQLQFSGQKRGLDNSINQMRILFGEESAMQILDEIMRVAASEDVNGPMEQPDFSRMPPATPAPPQQQRMDPMSVIRRGAGMRQTGLGGASRPMPPVRN
jgi:hypothetical protein